MPISWKTLRSADDLESALESSADQTIAIFKHSTRCPTSFMAKRQLESSWDFESDQVTPYFLDLIAFRDLSNAISIQTGVQHESPQLILIDKGQVIYHASHGMISTHAIRHAMTE